MFAIVEVGNSLDSLNPLKRALSGGPTISSQSKRWGIRLDLPRRDFWRPPALRFLPSQWTKRALGFLATPSCRTKRACRRVVVIWTEPRLRYQYYGEIKILAR